MSIAAMPRSPSSSSSTPSAPEENHGSASSGFAWAVGALALVVAALIAITAIAESSTIEKKAALDASQKAGTLDVGAVGYGLQMRLEGAAASCGIELPDGMELKVHATVDPTGAITHVHLATPVPNGACLANALSTVTVPPFSGSGTTVETELHVYGH